MKKRSELIAPSTCFTSHAKPPLPSKGLMVWGMKGILAQGILLANLPRLIAQWIEKQ